MMTTQSNKRTAQQRVREGSSGSSNGSMKSARGRHDQPHTKNNNNSSNRGNWSERALRNYFGSLPVVKVWGLALGLSHCVAWLPVGMQCERATGQRGREREGDEEAGPSMPAAAGRQHSQRGSREPTQAGRYQAGKYQAASQALCVFVCKAIGQLLDFDWNLKTWKCENVEIVKMLRWENNRQLSWDRVRT